MYQALSEFKLPDKFRGRSALLVQLWWAVQYFFVNHSPQFMYGWRNFWLRLFGAQIGKGVLIRPTVKIVYPWKLKIGDYSWVGDDVSLYTLGEIQIGSNTVISQKCYLCTGSHDYTSPTFDISAKKITIGNEVWLAMDVFIAPGVTINDGVVVGARSSVLHDLPKGMICFGNPAKVIRPRTARK